MKFSKKILFVTSLIFLFILGYATRFEMIRFGVNKFSQIPLGLKWDTLFLALSVCGLALIGFIIYKVLASVNAIGKHKSKLLVLAVLLVAGTSVNPGFQNNQPSVINVLLYGAKPDAVSLTDGVSNSTTTFTSATANFSAATDVGKLIHIVGAGAAGVDKVTTIASVTNSTTVVLTSATSTSGSSMSFDFGTDNTSPFQNAANAIPTTGSIYKIPLGYWLINGSVNLINPTRVLGDMSGRGTYFTDSSSLHLAPHSEIIEVIPNVNGFNIESPGSIWEYVDMDNTSGNTFTSGNGLNIDAGNVSIYNSRIVHFWNAIAQNYSLEWRMDHCAIGGRNFGVLVQNLNTADAGDWTINDCLFFGLAPVTCQSAIEILSSGGDKITNCKFNTVLHKCVEVKIATLAGGTSDFQMVNNSLENYDSTGINIIVNGTGVFSNVQIIGNQVAPYVPHTTGINMNFSGTGFLKGISIFGNVIYNQYTGDTAVKMVGITNAYIGNTIYGAWTKEMYIDATSTDVTVQRQMQTNTLADGTTITWDMSIGTNAAVTLGGNRTLAINSMIDGELATFFVTEDATGFRTLAAPANCILGGSAMTFFPLNGNIGATTVFSIKKNGSNYYVTPLSLNAIGTTNQVATFTGPTNLGGSANFTSTGTTTFLQNVLQLGNSINSTGVVPQLNSLDANLANIADMNVYPSTGTNVGAAFSISPKGTGAAGFKSRLYLFDTDFKTGGFTNYSIGFLGMDGTNFAFVSTAGGTGTARPMTFSAGVTPSIKINTSASVAGNVLLNNTTDNATAFLQVTSTTAQQAWHYDATHDLILTVGSTGIATMAATGASFNFTNSIAPTTNVTYDLGTSSLAWRDAYISHTVGKSAIGVSSSLGTNVSSVTLTGNDEDFDITLTTSGAVTGTLAFIAFGRTWGARPYCTISNANSTTGGAIAGSVGGYIGLNATSGSSMTLTGLITTSGTFTFNCHCGQ